MRMPLSKSRTLRMLVYSRLEAVALICLGIIVLTGGLARLFRDPDRGFFDFVVLVRVFDCVRVDCVELGVVWFELSIIFFEDIR